MKKITIELERETVEAETRYGTPFISVAPQRVNVMDRVAELANQEGLRVYHHQARVARQVLSERTVPDVHPGAGSATITERTVEYVWSVDIYLQ